MTQLPESFGRYQRGVELGHGGYATVYRAYDPQLRRAVALKVLFPHHAQEQIARERFLAEGRALAALQHPHIVPVYDVGQAGELPFFTMELIAGGTVTALIGEGKGVALGTVVVIVEQLASALDYLHAARLVHRDVKTDNVMLRGPGEAVLMDFGLARDLDASHGYTLTGRAIGTPEAMAPEQVRGERAAPAADLYALGVLAYKLLAGRPPFVGDQYQVLHAQVASPPPPLAQWRPDLPERIYAAVNIALAKDPERRPASAAAFVAMLTGRSVLPAVLHATGAEAPAAVDPRPAESIAASTMTRSVEPPLASATTTAEGNFTERRGHRRVALGLAGVLVAALIAGGGTALSLRGGGQQARSQSGGIAGQTTPVPTDAGARVLGTATPQLTQVGGAVPMSVAESPTAATDSPSPTPRAPASARTLAWQVDTFAGGTAGAADGQGTAAQFAYPQGIAVDGAGNVYVADLQNDTIRRITPDGVVSRLAGQAGQAGYRDGPAATAAFNLPDGIAVDGAGNIYVADLGNARIRKIDPQGMVTTLAGSGVAGFADGPAQTARFDSPAGLAVDAEGNVYVADLKNNRIRKIAPDGTVATVAGSGVAGLRNGVAAAAQFNAPSGVAVAADGTLYVADYYNNCIRAIAPDGAVTIFAGASEAGANDGTVVTARFNGPTRVVLDSRGELVVADLGNASIRTIGKDGVVSTLAGSGAAGFANGSGRQATFNQPEAVAETADGVIYVADGNNNAVRRLRMLPAQ